MAIYFGGISFQWLVGSGQYSLGGWGKGTGASPKSKVGELKEGGRSEEDRAQRTKRESRSQRAEVGEAESRKLKAEIVEVRLKLKSGKQKTEIPGGKAENRKRKA